MTDWVNTTCPVCGAPAKRETDTMPQWACLLYTSGRIIEELTSQMRQLFLESFGEINRHFGQILTELFGGGRAELLLEDPADPLGCGIEIKVQPPGKVIKNLAAISGGEQAFVAIAIYFAILKVNPAPFVILDEIEAALDDVNVAKYARYPVSYTPLDVYKRQVLIRPGAGLSLSISAAGRRICSGRSGPSRSQLPSWQSRPGVRWGRSSPRSVSWRSTD